MSEADSRPEPDRIEGAPHPRETLGLIGQHAAENDFLESYRAGRLHHAWLLTGPRGVGKATLAWRMARFLLAAPAMTGEKSLFGDAPQAPDSLDIPPEDPVARQVAALSEPRLFLLRRGWDDKADRLKSVITVDEVRKLRGFFGLSAAEGGRRVVIVDAADEMNNAAANALLKLLEEPPEGAVLILVSHQPSSLLPTIRSRCRTLPLSPVGPGELADALAACGIETGADMPALAELAEGSVGEAIRLINLGGQETYSELVDLFSTLPALDRPRLLKLADSATGRAAQERFTLLMDLMDRFLSRLARAGALGPPAREAAKGEAELLARLSPGPDAGRAWAELAQQLGARARHGMAVNLDPATLILDMGFRMDQTAAEWAARQGGS